MTLQESRSQRTLSLRTYDFESRATAAVSSASRQTGGEPAGWGEVALLAVPQLLLGVVVLSAAVVVKMIGG